MAKLGAKLVGMGAVPATLVFADGDEQGPLELQHVEVDDDTVYAVVYVQSGGTRSLARITGGVDDDELAFQIPTEAAEFESVEELLAADDVFETVRTVVGVETDL
ncbi:MAG: hypothetical protein ABEJ88_10360 [Halobacterium sp.]